MKTLFGERKSVKTLAFILALALILPLLPVMSVVGATTNISTVVFADARTLNVLYSDANESSGTCFDLDDFNGEGGTINSWQNGNNNSFSNISWTREENAVTLTGLTITARKGFSFKVLNGNLSKYAIQLSYTSTNGDSPVTKTLTSTDGIYTITPFVAPDCKDGKVTVKAVPIKSVTFPTTQEANDRFYLSGSANYGQNVFTIESVKFDVTPYDPTKQPKVVCGGKAVTPDKENSTTSNADGTTTYHFTLSGFEDGDVVTISLSDITYTVKLESPTSTDAYTVTKFSTSVKHGESVTFTVTPKPGKEAPKVGYKKASPVEAVDEDPWSAYTIINPDGNDYTIPSVTDNIEIKIGDGKDITFTANLVNGNDGDNGASGAEVTLSDNTGIAYDGTKAIKVSVKEGWKVTGIRVYDNNNNLIKENSGLTSITVSQVKSDLSVEVDVEPIVVTVNVVAGGSVKGPFQWNIKDNSDIFTTAGTKLALDAIKEKLGTSATRYGFTFDTDTGWTLSVEEGTQYGNTDIAITATGNWKVDYSKLFTLTTSAAYDSGAKKIIFTSRLVVNSAADDEAKEAFGTNTFKIKGYGFIYGQYKSTINDTQSTLNGISRWLEGKKAAVSKETKVELNNNLGISDGEGKVFGYIYTVGDNTEFDMTVNTYTQKFDSTSNASRSGLAFLIIDDGSGNTSVILGSSCQNIA